MQNIMQLESSHHINMRKRKVSVVFNEFDYLYRIVIIDRAQLKVLWHVIFFYQLFVYTNSCFYLFSLRLVHILEKIYCSKNDYHIILNEKIMKDDAELHCDIKKIIEVIVSLLKNRIKVDDSLDSKKARIKKFIKD